MSAATRWVPARRAALSALLDRAGGAGTDPGLALELTAAAEALGEDAAAASGGRSSGSSAWRRRWRESRSFCGKLRMLRESEASNQARAARDDVKKEESACVA